jgi:hypothetical protein
LKFGFRACLLASLIYLMISVFSVKLLDFLWDRSRASLIASPPENGAPACVYDCPVPLYMEAVHLFALLALAGSLVFALRALWLKLV